MTRRMLLTLIAILTGLSWQGTVVQARALPVPAQVSEVSALVTAQQAKASAVAARPLAATSRSDWSSKSDYHDLGEKVHVPSVLTRIDRARE